MFSDLRRNVLCRIAQICRPKFFLMDSLANSAHHFESASLLPVAEYTSLHNVRLIYDDVVCESNPRHLIKTYYQVTFMMALLTLNRF
ncbi:hypothetical protein RclHR1_08240012 [Rhizophagus clarus]|uniref:Uncharacterized protein n=1 Tax=Rhizophagus clarus TaxID=94130 RepID=A0A2Z6SFF0_9GLOM|nr:hypothetical protein RclHR1_08240012 [Rhizophagus clarus]GET01223.1 hypothetical protein GLOIN_2v1783661 [Rhizophagus clarus]